MKHSFKANLGELFPSDDEAAEWMFLLAVLRDDLGYESSALNKTTVQWEMGYFLRRLSVTMSEATLLLRRHLTDREFERVTGIPAQGSPLLAALRDAMNNADRDLPEVRNRVGAHLAPSNEVKGQKAPPKDVTTTHLRNHGHWEGNVTIGTDHQDDTTLRELTAIFFLFAWPDVVDDESLRNRAEGSAMRIAHLGGVMAKAIDELLLVYFGRRGLLRPQQ